MFGLFNEASDANAAAGVTPESLKARRALARALAERGSDASPVKHWLQGAARLGDALNGAIENYQTDKAEAAAKREGQRVDADLLNGGVPAPAATPGMTPSAAPAPTISADANDVSDRFIRTVQEGGITNPNALAAIGATGQRESAWSAKNAGATWSDPSESGQPGTSGGTMSWRGPRLAALQAFARESGEQGLGAPETQARFFLRENPQLVQQLNNAKSPEEAMTAMNNAWRFAGFNRPGGERDARIEAARAWAPRFATAPAQTLDQRGPVEATAQPAVGRGDGRYQVAQLTDRSGQAQQGAPQAAPQVGGREQLARAMAVLNNPFSSAGAKAVAQAMIQREQRDPAEARLRQLQIQEAEAKLQERPLTRRQQELAIQKAERDLQSGFRPATAQEKQALGLEPNAPVQIGPDGRAYPIVEGSGRTDASRATEDRRKAAEAVGLKPDSPGYQAFLLTGRMPREDQQPLSASDKRAIIEADEGIAAAEGAIRVLQQAKEISKKAFEGPLASYRGQGAALLGSEAGKATVELDNMLTTGALSQLKAIFGGAPTEGERKILLDIQGSSSMPRDVREKVYERAIEAANRRLEFNRRQSEGLRSGTYFRPGNAPQAAQPQSPPPQSQRAPAPQAAPQPATPQAAPGGFRILKVE
jgi:hypothetical protein